MLHGGGWNRGHPWVEEMTRGQGLGTGSGQRILRKKFSKLHREFQEVEKFDGLKVIKSDNMACENVCVFGENCKDTQFKYDQGA